MRDTIADTVTNIEDFTRMRQLDKDLSRLGFDPKVLKEAREEVSSIQGMLEEAQKKHRKLELARDSYTCPACSKTLQLCEGQLTLCPDTGPVDDDPQGLENVENEIAVISSKLKQARRKVLEQEHASKLHTKYEVQRQELRATYEDHTGSVDESLKTLQDDLEYLRDYKATQRALSKKIKHLTTREDMSEAYYISQKKVKDIGTQLERMKSESKPGEDLEIQDRKQLISLIDSEKELLRKYNSLTETKTRVGIERERQESEIQTARQKHEIMFKKVRSCELMEKWEGKYEDEVIALRQERQGYATTLQKIDLWQRFEEKRKSYAKLENRAKRLKEERG